MSDLVQRLTGGRHPLVFARGDAATGLKAAIERRYVLLKFTGTRGGTELGMPLDVPTCDLSAADFERGIGKIHLEGELELDYVRVRMVADVNLATLDGEGCLLPLTLDPPPAGVTAPERAQSTTH